jgi:NADH-quinone oxidoreductase subunit N
MGLFAKVAVFRAVISGGLTWLAVVMAVNVVIALFYYLRWAAALFTPVPTAEGGVGAAGGALPQHRSALSRSVPLGPRLAVGLALAVTVFFSLYPAPAFK